MEKPIEGQHQAADPVFPGENWFFYWKTSPALWEEKIRRFNCQGPLFVPINWTFHASTPDMIQFGGDRPETGLKTLEELAHKWGKEICFLVSLGPAPFLSNGGLPPFLSTVLSIDEEGLAQTILSNDFRINKLYSFYDPKVFQGFRKMVWKLGEYIVSAGLTSPFMGLKGGHIVDGEFRSFMDDRSIAFQQGFARYLSQKKHELNELTPQKELETKLEYIQLMDELYEQSTRECLVGNWEGTVKVAFLGGGPSDIFCRTSELWEHASHYFPVLSDIQVHQAIPSTVLLSDQIKQSVITQAVSGLVTAGQLKDHLDIQLFEDDYSLSFKKLVFFEIYRGQNERVTHRNPWRELGLIKFLNKEFSWTYVYLDKLESDIDEDAFGRITFVSGEEVDLDSFQQLLKLFLSGGQVCFDLKGASEAVRRRLDQFLIENSIVTEKLNYYSPIVCAKLGEGGLTVIDGNELEKIPPEKKASFWQKIMSLYEVQHLNFETDGCAYYWSVRSPSQKELKYEQIRKLSLFNPTSYKKNVRVQSHKNFAFVKTSESHRSQLQTFPVGVEVELFPGGHCSLDFGYFE